MNQIPKEKLQQMAPLAIYRLLLKNLKYYPSKNKFELLLATKEEFRQNANITDEKQIAIERKKAYMGLAHVLYYNERMDYLQNNYSMHDRGQTETLNPRDDDFIYF